ncbi:MAG: hypothetical protein AB1486_28290 [Planctomycetota bacterium]
MIRTEARTDGPAGGPAFKEADFRTFAKAKQRDPLFNEERRRLKGRLKEMGLVAQKALAGAGLSLELRTSLSHPYMFNGYQVDAMWLYLARPAKERKALQGILGEEFSEELDPSYLHLVLVLSVDEHQVQWGLRINERAWWDSQNLKAKCESRDRAAELARFLNELDGLVMRIHDWKKDYRCGELGWGDIQTFMKYFKPAEHRFSVLASVPKEHPLAISAELLPKACESFVKLIPTYRFIAWTCANDFIFKKG